MKMIVAIVQKEDIRPVVSELTSNGFNTTSLPSTGGFLSSKSSAILCGVEDEKVKAAIDIIKSKSHKRKKYVQPFIGTTEEINTSAPLEINVGGATVFVLDVEHFEKI